ncbi:hypothetical protein A946_03875 [Methylacidiphilum kamchatkense Kam1]|uniref:Uncharacterized protein n=1 Tax=Methylacidiphilum kamchatkense Kam1 TaxID=1202785 RepID=A0ABR4ZY91_9BACT|nr:hypothetical protein A946_03875 [Methylacidiphilum kamchatkense Kam1]
MITPNLMDYPRIELSLDFLLNPFTLLLFLIQNKKLLFQKLFPKGLLDRTRLRLWIDHAFTAFLLPC